MSFIKYCNVCDRLVCCSFKPNWCPWCGKDLQTEALLENFNTSNERLELLNRMRGNPDPPEKIPWDGYYVRKTGHNLLLKQINQHSAPQVEVKQISLF